MPGWYPALRAARYIGIAPWEMEQRPIWALRALAAERAENHAARMLRKVR